MAGITNPTEMKCSRCKRLGHAANECVVLPYYCNSSLAEQRTEAGKRRAEWQARQDEKAKATAEWEAKQAAFATRKLASQAHHAAQKDWERVSNATEASTVASATVIVVDEAEVERMAMLDKTVRKWVKMLRDIPKLEDRQDLDALQMARLARIPELQCELNGAKGLAKVRARDELRRQMCA